MIPTRYIAIEQRSYRFIYVNPDNFLGNPRVVTPERNREAWRLCKQLVERRLTEAKGLSHFYIVCGDQGSGKTGWVKKHLERFLEPPTVDQGFDEVLKVDYVRDSFL